MRVRGMVVRGVSGATEHRDAWKMSIVNCRPLAGGGNRLHQNPLSTDVKGPYDNVDDYDDNNDNDDVDDNDNQVDNCQKYPDLREFLNLQFIASSQ